MSACLAIYQAHKGQFVHHIIIHISPICWMNIHVSVKIHQDQNASHSTS